MGWSWRSSQGRSQSQQEQHLRDEKARNVTRDAAAKRAAEQRHAKGRDIPQQPKKG